MKLHSKACIWCCMPITMRACMVEGQHTRRAHAPQFVYLILTLIQSNNKPSMHHDCRARVEGAVWAERFMPSQLHNPGSCTSACISCQAATFQTVGNCPARHHLGLCLAGLTNNELKIWATSRHDKAGMRRGCVRLRPATRWPTKARKRSKQGDEKSAGRPNTRLLKPLSESIAPVAYVPMVSTRSPSHQFKIPDADVTAASSPAE